MRKESSTNFENEQVLNDYCSAFKNLSLINGRWKLSILFALFNSRCTYSDIKTVLPTVSDRILSLRLKELQDDLLLTKDKHGDKPVYLLTKKGLHLKIVLDTLSDWSCNKSENFD